MDQAKLPAWEAPKLETLTHEQAAAKRRGRPPEKDRAPGGLPARVRILFTWHCTGKEDCELFADDRGALRLLTAWANRDCMPKNVRVERKSATGWVAL